MIFKHKYVFLFPGLFVLIGILIFPIVFTVRLSLSGWNSYNPELNFIGLDNYAVVAEIWQHTDKIPSDEEDIIRVQDDFGR